VTNASPLDDPRIARGMQAQLARRRERLAAGAQPIGWKVGFGAPAAKQKLAITAPLVGFLTDAALLPAGATVSVSGWAKPVAEPEIAVYMGRDLGEGANRSAAQAAIAALGPAIELADLDRPPEDVEAILAGNIYQRHVVLGPRDPARAGCVLDGLAARILRNGQDFARTEDPQALTGDYLDIVRHVADVLAACGERLRAGEFIITGSIVPPLFVLAGETLAYELAPIGRVSVSLE
jgi:2-keto-4-pentenoate hydratase